MSDDLVGVFFDTYHSGQPSTTAPPVPHSIPPIPTTAAAPKSA
jgi:hypothetical protein